MLGTILILILVLALLVLCRVGRIAEAGAMLQAAAWGWFFSLFSYSCFSDVFKSCEHVPDRSEHF